MQISLTFQKIYDFYKHFYENLKTIDKRDRYTWGEKSENVALESLILISKVNYLSKNQQYNNLKELSFKIDLLKILLRLGNELKILDNKKYLMREKELVEIGKMIGGWIKTFG